MSDMPETENRFRWYLPAAFLVLIAFSPIVVGYLTQSENEIFMGYSRSDRSPYASFIKYSSVGDFKSPFNLESELGENWFNLLFFMLGQFVRAGVPVSVVYNLAQAALAFLLCFLFWRFAGVFFNDSVRRKTSYLIFLFGSGIGWILVPAWFAARVILEKGPAPAPLLMIFGNYSYDLSMAQLSTFQACSHLLHLAEMSLIIAFALFQNAWLKGKSFLYVAAAGAVIVCIAYIHPYSIALLFAACFLVPAPELIIDRRINKRALVFLLSTLPFFATAFYNLFIHRWHISKIITDYQHDPVQLHKIVLGYGFVLIFSLWGFKSLFKRRVACDMVIFSLLSANLIMFIGPYRPDKYIGYLMFPLSIIAAEGWNVFFAPFLRRRLKRYSEKSLFCITLAALLLAIVPSTAAVFALNTYFVLNDGRYELFVSRDDREAIQWLKENAAHRDAVLTSWFDMKNRETRNYPARYITSETGAMTLYTEKLFLIADSDAKERAIKAVFDAGTAEAERARILKKYEIKYIYYGPKERMLGAWNPEGSPLARKVFDSENVDIYLTIKSI